MAIKSSDQITVVDLTDAYSVLLTSEAASFAADKDGKALATTAFVTQVAVFRGTEGRTPTITQANIVLPVTSPTGKISASVSTSSPYSAANPGITITIASGGGFSGNMGEVDIPVVVDGLTIHKKFTLTASKTGNAGSSMYTHIRYATSSTGANMSATPTSSTTYIGIYVGSSSTAPSSASSYTWSKYVGTDGTPSYTFVRYSANADGTDFVTTPTSSTKYVGIAVTSTNSAPSAKTAYTWSKYVGDDGEDALSLVITSSEGTIFKNSQIATVLTAHVYQAGTELTATQIAALGTIKWYKDGSSTALSTTGTTLTISAGDVTNKAVYEARLEG